MAYPEKRLQDLERNVVDLDDQMDRMNDTLLALENKVNKFDKALDIIEKEVLSIRLRLDNYNQSHVEVI